MKRASEHSNPALSTGTIATPSTRWAKDGMNYFPTFERRHGRAKALVNPLPIEFLDPQFVRTVEEAMAKTQAAVKYLLEHEKQNLEQGVAIRREKSQYRITTSPPNSDVAQGEEQLQSLFRPTFAGALQPLVGATALVICQPWYYRNDWITRPSEIIRWLGLSARTMATVIIFSERAQPHVFTKDGGVIQP